MYTLGMPAKMPMKEARDHFGELVARAHHAGESTIVTRHGTDAAVIVSVQEYERMHAALLAQMHRKAMERRRAGQAVSTTPADLLREAGIA